MSPVKITKVKGGYSVKTPGGVKAKKTTKTKAKRQSNLLRGIEHGWKPTGKPATKKVKAKSRGRKTGVSNMGPGMPSKGMHKMAGGHMMKDSEMMMKGKAKLKTKPKTKVKAKAKKRKS